MKKAIIALALLSSTWYLAMAQQALDASGGSIMVGNNLFVDYSVGELATATTGTPGTGNYYTAGVVQPSDGVSSVDYIFDNLYYLRVFPNPVDLELTIETNYWDFQSFQFSNLLGQQVTNGSFDYKPIDVSWMAAGIYLLKLTSIKEQISKTIKIIKQ